MEESSRDTTFFCMYFSSLCVLYLFWPSFPKKMRFGTYFWSWLTVILCLHWSSWLALTCRLSERSIANANLPSPTLFQEDLVLGCCVGEVVKGRICSPLDSIIVFTLALMGWGWCGSGSSVSMYNHRNLSNPYHSKPDTIPPGNFPVCDSGSCCSQGKNKYVPYYEHTLQAITNNSIKL